MLPRSHPTRGTRVAALARLMCFGTTVAWIGLISIGVRARSEAQEVSVALARNLVALKDVLGPQTELRVNGNRVFAGGAHLDLPLSEVLDRFEGHCREHGWQGSDADVKSARRFAHDVRDSSGMLLTRHEDDTEGTVTCLTAPGHARGVAQLLPRVRAFLATGDLGQVGDLRYAFARRAPAGGTDLVNVWTQGAFDFKALASTTGDAPGRDLSEVGRPPGSRRMLDVELADGQYGLKRYRLSGEASAAVDDRAQRLKRRGWSEVGDSRQALERSFVKDGAGLILLGSGESQAATLDVLQLGSRGMTADLSGDSAQR